jgi:hypothetical protein
VPMASILDTSSKDSQLPCGEVALQRSSHGREQRLTTRKVSLEVTDPNTALR